MQPIRLRDLGDKFLIHYFMINSFFSLKFEFCIPYAVYVQKFNSGQWRQCWNDLLHMKFEEPTSNTEISGKNKNVRLYRKITILLILKTSLSLKLYYFLYLNGIIIMTTGIPH